MVCAAILIYAFAVIPQLQHRQKIKTIAAKIDAIMPATEPLYAVDPDYQPFLFYVERRMVYVSRLDDVSREARYLLVQPDNEPAAEASDRWEPLHATADTENQGLPRASSGTLKNRRRLGLSRAG